MHDLTHSHMSWTSTLGHVCQSDEGAAVDYYHNYNKNNILGKKN